MNGHERGRRFGGPWRAVKIAGMVVAGVVGIGIFALAFGWFVQLLWNWLMPTIFGLGRIAYWQAFGIVVLARLVFGGLVRGPGGGHHRGPGRWPAGRWEEHWGSDKWKHWGDYWRDEGKEAFERYVERKSREGQAGPGPAEPTGA